MMKKILFIIFLFIATPVFAKQDIARIDVVGDINEMVDKSDVRNVQVEYKTDDNNFSTYATLKLQGASTLKYPKKNYTITFFENDQYSKKYKVNLKWGEYSKYTLKANWEDPTFSRNLVASNIVGDINAKYGYFKNTPNNGVIDGFPVELYVNGEFHGLYTLNLHKDYMFDDGTDRDYVLISTDGNFFFDRTATIEDANWSNFEVEVGEEDEETLVKLNRLLTFINTSSDEEFKRDLEKYFNLDSLLNYYCYVRYADLVDSVSNNLFFLTYDGEIWYTVFYDLDISYGYTWDEVFYYKNPRNSYINSIKLWRKLEMFYPDHIVVRYNELREDVFTESYIINKFNSFYNSIPETSLTLERNKWSSDRPVYEITQVSDFLEQRTPVIDSVIRHLKTDNYDNVYAEFAKQDNNQIIEKKNNFGFIIFIIIILMLLLFLIIVKIVDNKNDENILNSSDINI